MCMMEWLVMWITICMHVCVWGCKVMITLDKCYEFIIIDDVNIDCDCGMKNKSLSMKLVSMLWDGEHFDDTYKCYGFEMTCNVD